MYFYTGIFIIVFAIRTFFALAVLTLYFFYFLIYIIGYILYQCCNIYKFLSPCCVIISFRRIIMKPSIILFLREVKVFNLVYRHYDILYYVVYRFFFILYN